MANQKSMAKNLTEGNLTKNLLVYTLPLLVSNTLQAVYNIVDMVVVGRVIGGVGLSAVSIGGDVLHLLTFIAMGFSGAGQVIVSQYIGAGKIDDIKKVVGSMFTLLISISIVVGALCFAFRHPILTWLHTPDVSYSSCIDYTVTCICGLPFIYGYNIVCGILRGMGDSKKPFYFIAIAAILNTVLDITFVAGLKMGAFGAALATVIGQAVSFITSLVYLYKRRESFGFDFKLKSFKPDGPTVQSIVSLGIPMAIQGAAINFSRLILASWINVCGLTYSALSGIFNKTSLVMSIVSHAFTTSGSAMTGQCIGGEKYEKVPKILGIVTIISLLICAVVGGLLVLFPTQIFSMFTSDEAVLAESSIIIVPLLIAFLGAATRTPAFALINGSGNSKLNLIVAILDGVVARLGLAYLFGFTMNLAAKGFWTGDAISGNVPFFIALVFFLSGKWKTNKYLIKRTQGRKAE